MGLRLRFDGDIETVLGTIVDDGVEMQRVGNLPARALDDEDAGEREPMRLEPALALNLGHLAGHRRTRRQEDDLPSPLASPSVAMRATMPGSISGSEFQKFSMVLT